MKLIAILSEIKQLRGVNINYNNDSPVYKKYSPQIDKLDQEVIKFFTRAQGFINSGINVYSLINSESSESTIIEPFAVSIGVSGQGRGGNISLYNYHFHIATSKQHSYLLNLTVTYDENKNTSFVSVSHTVPGDGYLPIYKSKYLIALNQFLTQRYGGITL